MMGAAIVAEGLGKRFGPVAALDGVNLELPAGGVLGLLGPNGAGKTTLVRILAALLKADRGGRGSPDSTWRNTLMFFAFAALSTGPETDVKVMATALAPGSCWTPWRSARCSSRP